MKEIPITERTPELIAQLMQVWEQAVQATHTFLSAAEIATIKKIVPQALRAIPRLVIAEKQQQPIGFMGIDQAKLEMLFIAPEARGQGVGRQLLTYGLEAAGITELSVNEQNPQAIDFYEHLGFLAYRRTAQDEQGNPYPILYMQRPMITTLVQLTSQQLDQLMVLWLAGNLQAHAFIPADYWQNNRVAVRQMLPMATLTVIMLADNIIGFAGVQNHYIAGLFVKDAYRDKGLGSQLIMALQQQYVNLTLGVYQLNQVAVKFYQRAGFTIQVQQVDSETNQMEYVMNWKRQ